MLTATLALSLFACTAGYQATNEPVGVQPEELAGAHRIYLGEPAHLGMPHVTHDGRDAVRVAGQLKRQIRDIELVDTPEKAEFVISVLFTADPACSHCEVGPDVEWLAIVERGGERHKQVYQSIGPFLQLNGRVRPGASVTRGFVRQLGALLRPSTP